MLSEKLQLIDAGLVLYVGLAFLFVWKQCCAWKCCGRWLQYANYCSLLLALVFVILVYDSYEFIQVALSEQGKRPWDAMPHWLRPWVIAAPGICLANFLVTALQTFHHVDRIKEESAVDRHDRAVQIVLLPAIYSIMGLSSLTRMYTFVGTVDSPYSPSNEELMHRSLSRSQTCLWVADLYEAWALYQFGKLTLDVIKSNIEKQAKSGNQQERAEAQALQGSQGAVESLVWLGLMSFLLVCVAEAGWSLWLLTFNTSLSAKDFEQSMSQFTIAGFLASCAALYNVLIVEESYHKYLQSYAPRLKFFAVKILVTFAFVQKGSFKVLMYLAAMLPKSALSSISKVPVIGELLKFPPAQFEVFYSVLMITECFLVCILHHWAWNGSEEWYEEQPADGDNVVEPKASLNPFEKSSYGAIQTPIMDA